MTKIYGPDANLIAGLLERARREGVTRRRLAAELGVAERTLRRWAESDGHVRLDAYRALLAIVDRATGARGEV